MRAAREGADKAAGDGPEGDRTPLAGMGLGLRVGADLVAGVVVGTLIGVGLDRWLGTRPWLMLGFFVVGAAAGLLNAYRTASGMDHSVGFGAARRRHAARTKRGDEDVG